LSSPPRLQLWAAFAAIYVLWGSNFLAIRYAAEAMPPFLLMAVRSLLAGSLLFAWARLRDGQRPTPEQWRAAVVVGTILFVGCHGLLAFAQKTVPSGVASLFLATIPVWLTLLDWLTGGPRPAGKAIAGLALSLAGLVVLIAPSSTRGAPIGGMLILIVSAFSWAAGSILSRRRPAATSLVLASGMQLITGGASLAVVGLGSGEAARLDAHAFSTRAVVAFVYMVGAASIVTFTAYMWLLRVSTPARVGTYAFVNPVVALFVGWVIGGEGLDARTLAASLVIVAGVALTVTARK